jgi:hypothetical protein
MAKGTKVKLPGDFGVYYEHNLNAIYASILSKRRISNITGMVRVLNRPFKAYTTPTTATTTSYD